MLQSTMGRYAQFFQLTFEKFFITAFFAKIANFAVLKLTRTIKYSEISTFLLRSEKLGCLKRNDLSLKMPFPGSISLPLCLFVQ